jgi:beta-lactamase class A
MQRTTSYCLGILVLFIGIALGHFLLSKNVAPLPTTRTGQVRANLPQYKFVNPLLFSESAKSATPQMKGLATAISSYIDQVKKDPSIKSVSVYFRDLNNAEWTGVNEDDIYAPSSMLKVLTMIAALKLSEQNPAILNEKLFYRKAGAEYAGRFEAADGVETGYYTLRDLIGYMIKYSDNEAFEAIVSDPKISASFTEMYGLFDLPESGLDSSTKDFMSPRAYSVIFRTLYNSSIFRWDFSDKILKLLSETTFNYGLVAGVPASTTVAHKFGENVDQLHDCGIIYYPNRPYLLCVMTRGNDLAVLESAISGVSKVTWNYIDNGNLIKR